MRTKFLIFSTCFISSALLILFIINIKKGQKPIFETKNINKELKTLNRFTNFFIENKGQLSDTICYYAKIKGGKVYITNSGKIFYSLISKKDTAYNIISFAENFGKEIKGKIIGKNKLKTKVNYFKGNNSEKWRKNIDCYKEICFGEIYHGINLSLKATNNNVEKIFTVMPGANPDNIKILLGNTSNIRINNKGELKIKTIQGEILFTKPIAYQKIRGKKQFVDITYTIDSSNYGFKIGEYNNDYPLIIDPLINSTYIGGSGMEQIKDAIQDKDGNIFICGYTSSGDFPTTQDAYMQEFSMYPFLGLDIFIAKFNEDLSELLSSTFLGGWHEEIAYDMTINNSGNVYITGITKSPDFPTTSDAYSISTADSGYSCGFISCLNNDLSNLIASTCIGGEGEESYDACNIIELDNNNSIFFSGNFSELKSSNNNNSDNGNIFIGKFNQGLTKLVYKYIGGSSKNEIIENIKFDSKGNLVIAGFTESIDFPVTENAYQSTFGGTCGADIFVLKLSPDLENIIYCTYLGGKADDWFNSIYIAQDGKIFISGVTDTFNTGLPQLSFSVSFDSTLSQLTDSTIGTKFDFENNGYFYAMVGDTAKKGTLGSFRDTMKYYTPTTYYCQYDIAIHKIAYNLKKEFVKTYFGPVWSIWGNEKIFPLNNGNILLTFGTMSDSLPLTKNSWCKEYIGGEYGAISPFVGDCYLAILDSNLSDNITAIYATANKGGIISPSGTIKIEDSLDITFNITPDNGYNIKNVWIDHTAKGPLTSYSFRNVKEDHYIDVEFDSTSNSINNFNKTKISLNCYPNPFKNFINISYDLNNKSYIELSVFDLSGKLVKILFKGNKAPGSYTTQWNGRHEDGNIIKQGVYFLNFRINNKIYSKKLVYY